MRFLSSFFFASLFLLVACQQKQTGSQASGPRYNEANIPERLDSTLLWELRGKGIKKPSYIFGTIHLLPEKDYFFSPPAKEALGNCKRLVTEIDMSNQMAMAMQMMSMAPMKDTKLKDLLSEEDYSLVKNYFEKESKNPEIQLMPFSMIENWKPMLLQSFLYQDMLGGQASKSYEMELMSKGRKAKMGFGGLETLADQMGVFDKIPYKDQAQALVEMVKSLQTDGQAEGKNEFEEMVGYYVRQDIDGMVEMALEGFKELGDSEEAMLNNRNRNWIPLIIEMAQKEPTFFAVGAAHLGGDEGVLRLLMQEGYELRPLENK